MIVWVVILVRHTNSGTLDVTATVAYTERERALTAAKEINDGPGDDWAFVGPVKVEMQ